MQPNESKKKLSLIMIIRQFYPLIGGTEKQAALLARKLQERGCSIKLITARLSKVWKKNELIEGLEVVRLPSPRIRVLGTLIYVLSLIYYLFKHRKHYDCIHVHRADYDAVIAITVGRLIGKKVLIKLACSGPFGDLECLRRSPITRLALWIISKAQRVIAVNEDIKKELLQIGLKTDSISMIPNGVDSKIFKPSETIPLSKKKMVTYVGRLHEQKGVEYLLRSWAMLAERFRLADSSFELNLNIIGEGPLLEKLVNLAGELNIENRVNFLGTVNNVAESFQRSDVFVNASLNEGISNSLLEAMACGLPIVATNISGNNELIQDAYNGLLVPPKDTGALTRAMECLLTDSVTAKKLGVKARETIELKYAGHVVAKEYMELYRLYLDTSMAE
jgi:glycosyltransferase involved in cell wall biosynthesis